MRLAAVSVDLDEIGEYLSIHGLPALPADHPARHAVYDRALARIDEWSDALGIPVTFFAVGRDLDRPANAAALRRLAAARHAVESHSMSHRYDLTTWSAEAVARDVRDGLAAVERATGVRPEGFRAPGYTVSDALFDALDESGVRFDSSVFPSPVYYGAKAAVLAWMKLRGRASATILDTPRVLAAPRAPYRPGPRCHRPARPAERARGFVELPILVSPLVGFPVIGTSVGRAGVAGARALARACSAAPLLNLELHGMDFLSASDLAPPSRPTTTGAPEGAALGLAALTRAQPELRPPLPTRLARLAAFVAEARSHRFTFVTLREAASAFR